MAVLEIACFGVKAGINAADASTPEGAIARDMLSKGVKQPGAHTTYVAHSIENPTQLWIFMGWDNIEAHRTWQGHPDNANIRAKLAADFVDPSAGPSFVKHAAVSPFPVSVLDTANAGAVEVLAAYFPAFTTDEEKAKVAAVFDEFAAKSLSDCADFKGASFGWGVENDFPLPGAPAAPEGDSAGHAVYWALAGWTSVEAHKKFHDTDDFKDNIGLLKSLPGLVKVAVNHVICKAVKA